MPIGPRGRADASVVLWRVVLRQVTDRPTVKRYWMSDTTPRAASARPRSTSRATLSYSIRQVDPVG